MTSWGTNQSSLVITTVLGWVPVTACWTLSSILTEQKANRETGRGGGKKKKKRKRNESATILPQGSWSDSKNVSTSTCALCHWPPLSFFFLFFFYHLSQQRWRSSGPSGRGTCQQMARAGKMAWGRRGERKKGEKGQGKGGGGGGVFNKTRGKVPAKAGDLPPGCWPHCRARLVRRPQGSGGETDVKALNWVCLGCELAHSTNGVEGSPGVERRKLMPQHQQPELG